MTSADSALQSLVDAQLLEQGAFAPLELLFNSGRLLYSDYESWRRREVELLDGVLMGNTDKIKAEIEQAVRYAKRIGLVEQAQEFHAWHTDTDTAANDRPLRISMDSQMQRLIGSRYVRAQSVPQMDLFFDNPVVALTNGITQALATRNLPNAQRLLDQLYTQAPTHTDLAAFDQLLSALARLGQPVDDVRRESHFLLEITPTARRLLGAQYRDLLSPLWSRLGAALGDTAFDPLEPNLHRSYALSQAQDWAGVADCVTREPDWQQHAPLCIRFAESALNRRRRIEALAAWSHACWRAPANLGAVVSPLRQPELTTLWQRFQEDQAELEDAAERDAPPAPRGNAAGRGPTAADAAPAAASLTEAEFPAWLLLYEPGLALQLAEDLPPGDTAAEQSYRILHRWLEARRARRSSDELAQRKALQASSPALFALLKRTV